MAVSRKEGNMLDRILRTVEVGVTPYLSIVDTRNAFVRIYSIDHPGQYIDVYKGTLERVAEALVQCKKSIDGEREKKGAGS